MTIGRSQAARLRVAVLVAAILVSSALDARGGAHVRSERLVGPDVPGLHLTADVALGALSPQSRYWHIYEFDSHAAAEAARPARGIVAEGFGRHSLYIIADEAWRALGVSRSSAAALAQPGSSAAPSPSPTPSGIDLLMPQVIGARLTAESPRASVEVDGKLQGLVDDLLQRSPAFRRQWQRMLGAARLSVRIELVHANRVLNAHAATVISTLPDGSVLAIVAIPGGLRRAELIAHEVEHILERLDGARVASQHALGDTSVRRASGTFETARAVFVGQMVAAEHRPR